MKRKHTAAGILAIVMMLSLLLGMLAGCGGDTPTEPDNGTTTGETTGNTQETTAPAEERVLPSEAMAAIYEPDSGIVNPPTPVQWITTALPDLSGRTPAVALMEIDANLNVLDEKGNVLCTVEDFLIDYSHAVIPGFIIDSQDEVPVLAQFLGKNKIIDVFIVAESENAAMVKEVRQICTAARGALIFDSLDTAEKRQEARKLVNDNLSFVAISRAPLDQETVNYFNVRQISAWSFVEDTAGVYAAIAVGNAGVIAEDPEMVYDVYESITATTVSGKPVIIAHRGAHIDTPENTIMGFHEAQDTYGAMAVETDIRVTTDGIVFLMHDKKVDRTTNGSGVSYQMTWEELNALIVDEKADYGEDRISEIPMWEEVLQEFGGSDLVFYCHNKTLSSSEVEEFCELVEQYGFEDNIVFFNGFSDMSRYHYGQRVMCDGITYTAGDYPLVYAYAKNNQEGVASFIKQLGPHNYQPLFYSYGENFSNESFYYAMAARGFINSHSITNGQETLNETLLTGMGAVGLLTDELNNTDDYHYYVEASDETLTVGQTIDLTRTVQKIVGTEEVVCGITQIDGPALTASGDSYTLNEAGTVTVVFYANKTAEGGAAYRVYSEPVTITFVPA